jgi:hypothetical protein
MKNIVVTGGFVLRDFGIKREYANVATRDLDIIGTYDDVVAFIKENHNVLSIVPADSGNKIIARVVPATLYGYKYTIIEAEIAWMDSNAEEFMNLVMDSADSVQRVNDFEMWIPNLHAIYAMKMSHRFLRNSPHFVKTMLDIKQIRQMLDISKEEVFLRGADTTILPHYRGWYKRRVEETYTYSHPKLNVDKTSFFTDDVPYKYDHDSIHEAVKFGEHPAYKGMLDGPVKVSVDLWMRMPNDQRLACVIEESMVLALERSIIPYGDKGDNGKIAYLTALQKVCTSITSGWFREFAWENYELCVEMFPPNYISWFRGGLANGTVKPFEGKNAY